MGVRLPSSAQQRAVSSLAAFFVIRPHVGPDQYQRFKNSLQLTTLEITLNKLDDVTATLTINIAEADYSSKYQKQLKNFAAKAQIKGFRPGKVPVAHVERLYGLSIKVDVINELLGESVDKYLTDNNVNIFGNALPHNGELQKAIDWKADKEYSFVFDLGLVPAFEAPKLESLDLTTYGIDVNDENVAESLAGLQQRMGDVIEPETSEPNDEIYGELAKADGSWSMTTMVPSNRLAAAFVTTFAGKKVGDVVTFDLAKAFDTHQIQHLTGLSHEEAEKVSGDYTLTITKITRRVPAELNNEFFGKIFPNFPAEGTEEEFMERLRAELVKAYEQDAYHFYTEALRKHLMQAVKIDLPEAFIGRWLQATNDKMSDAEVAKNLPYFLDDLRWTIIRDQIMTNQLDLKPSYEMVVDHVTQANLQMFAQYGLAMEGDDRLVGAAREMAENHLKADNGKNWNRASQEAFTAVFFANARKKVNETNLTISVKEFEEKLHMLVAH